MWGKYKHKHKYITHLHIYTHTQMCIEREREREREREMPLLRLIPAPPFLRKVIKIIFLNPSCGYLLINLRLFNKEYIC